MFICEGNRMFVVRCVVLRRLESVVNENELGCGFGFYIEFYVLRVLFK